MGGFRNLNLTLVLTEIANPIILVLSLCITVPYVLSLGLLYETGERLFSELLSMPSGPVLVGHSNYRYRMAGNIAEDLNLVDWWFGKKIAKLNST